MSSPRPSSKLPRVALALVLLGPGCAPAENADPLRNSDFVPNEAFNAAALPPPAATEQAGVDQVRRAIEDSRQGEVIILEGTPQFVATDGNGNYGLAFSRTRQDPMSLTNQFIDTYGDEYDFVVVWTSFPDRGTQAIAYYVGIRAFEEGIGVDRQNDGRFWGSSADGKLQGFLNMGTPAQYPGLDGRAITDPRSFAVSTLGQELTHRWLAFMRHRDDSGRVSNAMLGRDNAHWSALMHAEASVQDGNAWEDNGDGTFTLVDAFSRFSTLDLYGMGIIPPEEVEPFFLIDDGTFRGRNVAPASRLPIGAVVQGDRVDVDIDDVISAMGDRTPTAEDAQKEFRAAFVLVTRPGESADQVRDMAAELDQLRASFEETWRDWTGGLSVLCTRVDARCDLPAPRVGEVQLDDSEPGGDGDGLAEPGETLTIRVELVNGGTAAAGNVVAQVSTDNGDLVSIETGEVSYPLLEPGMAAFPNEAGFVLKIPEDASCGATIELRIDALAEGERVGGGTYSFPLGILESRAMHLDVEPEGWRVNPDGTDTAIEGFWEWTDFSESIGEGRDADVQPIADHTVGDGGGAWVTGPAQGRNLVYEDLDAGTSTLETAAFDLSDALDPTLSFWVWHMAVVFDRETNALIEPPGEELVISISADGGATWTEVMKDAEVARRWRELRLRVRDYVEPSEDVRLRFAITDADEDSLVEAAVDDIRIFDVTESCPGIEPPDDGGGDGVPDATPEPTEDPEKRGGVSSGCQSATGTPWLLAPLLMGLPLLRRRRR